MVRFMAFLVAFLMSFGSAQAAEPIDWELGFQPFVSPVGEKLDSFHNMMLVIIFAISALVLFLLLYVMIRYNKRANPTPSKFSHNTLIEIIWTGVPVIILLVIIVPSIKMLYFMDRVPNPEMTIKVTGYQWYWGYEYPDHGGIYFDSYMIADDEIDESKGQRRLLSTDNELVLPINTNIQILVTAADVLHAWAVPAFGVKTDAVPGRMNETWVNITEPGVYFGQCSEICGTGHAYMPITVRAVTKKEFENWLVGAKKEFASNDNQIDISRSIDFAAAQ